MNGWTGTRLVTDSYFKKVSTYHVATHVCMEIKITYAYLHTFQQFLEKKTQTDSTIQ